MLEAFPIVENLTISEDVLNTVANIFRTLHIYTVWLDSQ